MNEPRHEDGFTLIELMLAVTIIGIVAAIAIPSLGRARAAATEASTIESLHTLNLAQVSYATSCAGGFYAPSITWLAIPPSGTAAFVGPEFTADTIVREGYTIRFIAGTIAATSSKSCNGLAAAAAVLTYFIGADPLQIGSSSGVRHFGTNSATNIYQSLNQVNIFYSGTPPAPAQIIQ
jgi:prepilin-type N-terminal cleavage/methylation domain-containing protein